MDFSKVLEYKDLFIKHSIGKPFPWTYPAAFCKIESGGNPRATSFTNNVGLMQITRSYFLPSEDPFDPDTNIRYGCDLLASKWAAVGGDAAKTAAAYYGAYDPTTGEITSATDGSSVTGWKYAALLFDTFVQLTNQLTASTISNVRSTVDPDFAKYAPNTGEWREAAINLLGVATDALEAGRREAKDAEAAIAAWGKR